MIIPAAHEEHCLIPRGRRGHRAVPLPEKLLTTILIRPDQE